MGQDAGATQLCKISWSCILLSDVLSCVNTMFQLKVASKKEKFDNTKF